MLPLAPIAWFLLLLWSGTQVQAQSGYNYVRPELAATTAAGAGPTGVAGARLAGGAALLPGAYPTAAGLPVGVGSAPATTAYGAALFPATTAFGAPAGNTAPNLPAQRRPSATAATPLARGGGGGSPYGQPQPQYNTAPGGVRARVETDNDYNDGDYSAIPGQPGVDYPVYAQVPRTNFDCAQQALPGYYADIEAQCQVFHICALNRTYSFLCPNGTVFSQETLVCVWWNQYDCVSAPNLYSNNAYIYDYSSNSNSINAQPQPGNVNVNTNAYQFGARSAVAGNAAVNPSLRPTGLPQASGFVGANTARVYSTPSPTVVSAAVPQPQAQFGTVIRSGNPLAGAGRIAGAGPIQSVAASTTVVGGLPENAVGSFAQPVASGNREYLPPNTAVRRQRAAAIVVSE